MLHTNAGNWEAELMAVGWVMQWVQLHGGHRPASGLLPSSQLLHRASLWLFHFLGVNPFFHAFFPQRRLPVEAPGSEDAVIATGPRLRADLRGGESLITQTRRLSGSQGIIQNTAVQNTGTYLHPFKN